MAKAKYITPKGALQYPYLFRADTKYNEDGEYRTKLKIPAGQFDETKARLDELLESAEEKANTDLKGKEQVETVAPYMIDEEDGSLVLNFKMKAIVKPKGKEPFKQKPIVADSKGVIISKPLPVGSGSLAKVQYEVIPYLVPSNPKKKQPPEVGLTLRLRGVQILKLVAFSSTGFKADDEGEFAYEEGDDEVTNEADTSVEENDDF